ncbi:hypothetical protein C9J22_19785 [Photobacterium phosphoreum]|jgi:uncharacterized protein (DUF1778 family)|uniref:DUF1778 domain-containing protein n=1 Tax=Photobacterium iliopiscarium TaxID=56192 RepID=A0A2T3MF76_9GAMM|nr:MULTISPECIES: DUF1778 domain-containing protein [Photobacterium]MCD9527499.1 DUF1778 domain-containing protein [Photobacterium carnosum]PSU67426.1 hypothetical protein C9J22_19785 [Photobacterium phosphoreum]PSV92435.1 hypothetical protein C9I88_16430 [Photobacterium iliopiscarium]
MATALKSERIEIRLPTAAKNEIEEAALIQGKSVSSYVFECAALMAKETIREHRRSLVCNEQWDSLMEALENPPAPTPLMQEIISLSMGTTWTIKINK